MNTIKNFTTMHLWLTKINVLEVVILLMTYLIKYVFQKKNEDLNMDFVDRIAGIMKQRFQQNIYYANLNVDLMEENIIQMNNDKC